MKIKFVLFFLMLIFYGCSENKESNGINEESAPEDLEYSFGIDAPIDLVSLEKLPEWLQNEIKTFESEARLTGLLQAYKGEWKDQTIYAVENIFCSSKPCYFRYENGESLEPIESLSVYSTSKNWTLIYEYRGPSYFGTRSKNQNFLLRNEIKDKYEFPDISEMNKWDRPNIIQERLDALQIPEAVLSKISTEGLLETCMEFPYLLDIFLYDNFQKGFEELQVEFNGFREILKRPDLAEVLIEKYFWMIKDVTETKLLASSRKGKFSFQHFVLEYMIAQDVVLTNLNKEQEETLFLLALEYKEIKNSNPDIFSGLNELPTYLLYAKKIMNDNLVDPQMMNILFSFIQNPAHINHNTINYLNNHFNSKYL